MDENVTQKQPEDVVERANCNVQRGDVWRQTRAVVTQKAL